MGFGLFSLLGIQPSLSRRSHTHFCPGSSKAEHIVELRVNPIGNASETLHSAGHAGLLRGGCNRCTKPPK